MKKTSPEERWRLDTDDRYLMETICHEINRKLCGLEPVLFEEHTLESEPAERVLHGKKHEVLERKEGSKVSASALGGF